MWSKQTDRSALNQNRREQLSVTKLIPYLGLHKNSINTWKVCNPMHIAKKGRGKKKRFPWTKKGAKKKQQHLQFQSLLVAGWSKKRGGGTSEHVCACGHSWWFRQAKEAYDISWSLEKNLVSPLVLPLQLRARDLFNSLQLDLLRRLTVAPARA